MILLDEAVRAKKFDARLTQRHLERAVFTQDELQKNLDSLPDDADAGEWVSIESLIGDDQ